MSSFEYIQNLALVYTVGPVYASGNKRKRGRKMADLSQKPGQSWRLLAALRDVVREIGVIAIGGLLGALILLGLFAKLTDEVFENDFANLDKNFELWVHSFANAGFSAFFEFFTTLGGIPGIAILSVVTFVGLIWRRHYHSAWLLALTIIGGLIINQTLKLLFQRPRPELWAITGVRPTTFSFPSGHSTMSFCYFGFVIWLCWRWLKPLWPRIVLTIMLGFVILLVGLSRIYFGVHYPTDVLAGYLSAAFWLATVFSGGTIYRRLHQSKTLGKTSSGHSL